MTNCEVLCLEKRLLHVASSFLQHETYLLKRFIDGHSSDETCDVPHLLRAVFNVLLYVANKLKDISLDFRLVCVFVNLLQGEVSPPGAEARKFSYYILYTFGVRCYVYSIRREQRMCGRAKRHFDCNF